MNTLHKAFKYPMSECGVTTASEKGTRDNTNQCQLTSQVPVFSEAMPEGMRTRGSGLSRRLCHALLRATKLWVEEGQTIKTFFCTLKAHVTLETEKDVSGGSINCSNHG